MEKKYNNLQSHIAIQDLWDTEQIYSKDLCDENKPLFTIDTPPPTVSGSLHIGHIFSYTHTDIIARYKRLSGYRVFYPFGFDDNGLPTERFVEKEKNTKAHILSRAEFQKICLEESQHVGQKFKALWKKMGLSAHFEKSYSTISPTVQKISQTSFLDLLAKKLVYRKYEPALYCTHCHTSVAQAELDDTTKETCFYTFIFGKDPVYQENNLLIGTTRPELLGSCVAVMFHPDDARYQHLHNKTIATPLYHKQVPFLADELVDPLKGTGLVMVCTFGDKTDIAWFKKHNLAYHQSVSLEGKIINQELLAGLTINAARKKIVEILKNDHLIIEEKNNTHTVSVHERCKNPVEYLLLSQWFVSILPFKQELIDQANSINWYPSFMKARYIDWVENLGWDWCISRQRPYGIAFPVWHCTDCSITIPAAVQDLPIDPQSLQSPRCSQCQGATVADTDVMDTWNTSSITPYIVYHMFCEITEKTPVSFEKKDDSFFPLSLRPQAHDIIRTWAFDTIVKSYAHNKIIPWNDIAISGHVLSEKKEKISKSRDNETTKPEELLNHYDADALRYWAGHTTLGYDTPFSPDQIKQGQRLITKLWNAFLCIEPHLAALETIAAPSLIRSPLNQWIINQANTMTKAYKNAFESYETGIALGSLEHFFWHDYCDNYIEIIKNILFNPELYSKTEWQETLWTLHSVGLLLLQHYAPFIPFITEAIYQELYRTNKTEISIHTTNFITFQERVELDDALIETGQSLFAIASAVRKLKTEHKLSLKTTVNKLSIMTDKKDLLGYQQIIKGVTQALAIEIIENDQAAPRLIQTETEVLACIHI